MDNKEKESLNKAIGRRVRDLSEYNNFTRENLAEYADISVQFLADIEAGRKSMTTTVLYKMARSLHVSTDYLVYGNVSGDRTDSIQIMLETLSSPEREMAERILQYYIRGLSMREENVLKQNKTTE